MDLLFTNAVEERNFTFAKSKVFWQPRMELKVDAEDRQTSVAETRLFREHSMKKLFNPLVFAAACLMFTLAFGGVAHALVAPVPELDPGTASSGVALLVGGALLLIERYRRRR